MGSFNVGGEEIMALSRRGNIRCLSGYLFTDKEAAEEKTK